MSIVRVANRTQYVVITQATIEDRSISWEALGLLVYLLGKPDDWKVSVTHLSAQRQAGRDKIYRLLRELITAGYARREYPKDENGQNISVDFVVFEEPQNQLTANPEVGNQLTENPEGGGQLPDFATPNLRQIQLPDFTTLPNTEYIPNKQHTHTPAGARARAEFETADGESVSVGLGPTHGPLPTVTASTGPKFQMTHRWQPPPTLLADVCSQLSANPEWISAEVLAEFRIFWTGEGKWFTEYQWASKLVMWAKNQQTRCKPTPASDDRGFVEKHADSGWADGL